MEELITRVIEQSIVSGGFLWLLYYVIHKQEQRLEQITDVLSQMSKELALMSQQLAQVQVRLNEVEREDV